MATSPSDENNLNVIAWLDRLKSSYQSSIKTAGGTNGSGAFKFESRKNTPAKDDETDSDSAADRDTTVRGKPKHAGQRASSGLTGRDSGGSSSEEVDKISVLPDDAAPLGLIAKLSLNNRGNGKHRGNPKDEEDVVSFLFQVAEFGLFLIAT